MNRRWLALAIAALCLAWLNPQHDRIDAATRLFKQGKYDDARSRYGEALVDDPDSALLNFNMGDANYKAGKFTEALASFQRVRAADDDPKRVAATAYNSGNAAYRLAAAAEAQKPEDALNGYAAALIAYRRALGADPSDRDAKFNYEFVSRKLDELKKKLEQQKKDQEKQQQQQQQNQSDAQNQQQPEQPQDQGEQQNKEQQQNQQAADQSQPQQPDGAQQHPDQSADGHSPGRQPQDSGASGQDAASPPQATEQGAAAAAGGEHADAMSQQEAAALIDTAKNDELQPDEFARQVQGSAVAEPAQDW